MWLYCKSTLRLVANGYAFLTEYSNPLAISEYMSPFMLQHIVFGSIYFTLLVLVTEKGTTGAREKAWRRWCGSTV